MIVEQDLDECNVCGKRISAARDKWWIDKIDAMFVITLSSGEKIMQSHIVITHTEWEQFKNEMERK